MSYNTDKPWKCHVKWKKPTTKDYMEPIIHSEVSQKEKYQYSILMHIYGI